MKADSSNLNAMKGLISIFDNYLDVVLRLSLD